MRKREFHTDFLTPDQDELTGMASVLDIFGAETPYNYSKSGEEADIKAIASDWAVIGEDISEAIQCHKSND